MKEKITYKIIDELRCLQLPFTLSELKKQILKSGGSLRLMHGTLSIEEYLDELIAFNMLTINKEKYCSSIDNEFKYLIAEGNNRRLCVKYTSQWALSAFNYLHDKGYKLKQATGNMWITRTDEEGNDLELYWLDEETDNFNIDF